MPRARRALEDGEPSLSALRILAQAREVEPEAFRDAESHLVEAARLHSTDHLQRVASSWRQAAERERAAGAKDKLHTRRRLFASATVFGMVRVDGDLDPEGGETLLTALRAVVDSFGTGGAGSPAVTGRHPGVTPTMWCPGPREAPPPLPT